MKLTIILLFLFPAIIFGQSYQGTFLKKGQGVPVDGYFFDVESAVTMKYKIKKLEEFHKLDLDFEVQKTTLQLQKKIDILEIDLKTEKDKRLFETKIYNEQSKFYDKLIEKKEQRTYFDSRVWWFVGGVAMGVGTSYLIYRIAK